MEQKLRVTGEKGDDSLVLFGQDEAMLRSGILFILMQAFCLTVYAEGSSPQRQFMEQFQSSRLSFPDEKAPILMDASGRYPFLLNILFQNVLSWVPTGEPAPMMTPGCVPDVWAERLQDPRVRDSVLLQGALVQKYLQDCRTEVTTGSTGGVVNMTRMLTMKYDPQEHPFLRRVVVNLPGNIKLKGILGLKGDRKRRPMVIVRLGIFSNIEDFKPERAWMMMLFEQSPFNVLFLENMTSGDFVQNNSQFSFGGYDEGIQNILVAQLLKNPQEPISNIVESVHVFGVSLGGHGVLFSSLLNETNSAKASPLIQSFMALCPVVNLQETMQNLTQGGIFSAFVDIWSRQRLKGLDEKLSGLSQYDNFSYLKKAISEITRTYTGGLSYISSIRLPAGMKDGQDFWAENNFWKYYKNVKQPVLIFATKMDPAVPFELNSGLLQNKILKVDSKNIRVVEFPEGYHCTLPIPYDWKVLTSLFQSYILSHSPHFQLETKSLTLDLGEEEWGSFAAGADVLKVQVSEPDSDESFVKIEIVARNKTGEEKSMSLSLPLSDFDFRFYSPELTDSETEMIRRWANQNLKVEILPGKKSPQLKVSWAIAR